MHRRNLIYGIATIAALLALFVPQGCLAGPIVYSLASNPVMRFGVADLGTGLFAPIGAPLPSILTGIGYGTDGQIYSVDANNNLIRIDPRSGATTTIGPSGIALLAGQPDMPAVGFAATASGALYGNSWDNTLYRFDQTTGAATAVGPSGIPVLDRDSVLSGNAGFVKGMAGLGGAIFVSSHAFNLDADGNPTTDIISDALYRLDVMTGAATKVGDLDPFTWLLGGVNGLLYAEQIQMGLSGPAIAVLTLDPETAAATTIATDLPMDRMFDGALSVPEPSALLLLGSGVCVIAIGRRRRGSA